MEEEIKIECLNPDDDYMWYSPTMECHKCGIGIVGTEDTVKKCPRCGNKKLVKGKGHD